ncbi:maestro heat-like repeat-containing protein family member 1 isoform X3 [Chelonia mydas]|uniref:maestro heat-like repeat-containing protein family member 1 isoform X3 n=1 Tax=Chelonia mydas TaxID=8469 RepID=UPI0018A23FBB|nr:maestro heat-like repeat-containing protein family member 1 isoform X3 [Chelonia mydas]XP_037769250.1 maestro heat-like repeat-containing protein family member 1 isoform X3 [Chelonia mydas]XP_043384835.1 maestro heat-like repeat-containing protein family member 1 isoform X3 [Chelonia mydas]
MKPALEPALETHLLRAALHSVFTLGTEKDTTDIQALHKVIPEVLDAMLGNLLAESPDTDRLHFILEHVNLWVVSRVSQERARAIRSSTALLRYTVTLPEFDISAEFPRMGHHVAQLALFVSDPDKDISRQAREGTYRLYQLLLQQRGLTIHDAEDLWCYDWHQDRRLLGYKNTARVGEVRTLCQGMTQLRECGWLGSLQWMPPGDRKRALSLFPPQSSSSSNQWDRLVLKVPHWNLASCRDLSVLHGCIATWHKEDPRVGELR